MRAQRVATAERGAPMPDNEQRNGRRTEQRRRILIAGLSIGLLLVAVLIVVWIALAPSSGTRETKNCAELRNGDTSDPASPHFLLPKSEANLGFAWTFEDPGRVYEDTTRLEWETVTEVSTAGSTEGSPEARITTDRPADIDAGSFLDISMTRLVNKGSSRAVPDDQIGYLAITTDDAVEVQVCIDARGVAPGVYTGALEFTDDKVRSAPIAVQVTVPYGDERIPLTFFIVGALIAIALVLLRAWGTSDVPVFGLVFALTVAILVAMTEVGPLEVRSDPGWGARTQDFVSLTIATVLAVLGASALGEILPDLRTGGDASGQPTGPAPDVSNGEEDG